MMSNLFNRVRIQLESLRALLGFSDLGERVVWLHVGVLATSSAKLSAGEVDWTGKYLLPRIFPHHFSFYTTNLQ